MRLYKKDIKNVYSLGTQHNMFIRFDIKRNGKLDLYDSIYVQVFPGTTFFGRKYFQTSPMFGEILKHDDVIKKGYKVWDFDKAWLLSHD